MSKKDTNDFHKSIQKLRALREELCSKKTTGNEGLATHDFVICELQEIHERLSVTDDAPEWCKEKIEYLLTEMLSRPCSSDNEGV